MKAAFGFLFLLLCTPITTFALSEAKWGPNKDLMECFADSQIGGFSSVSRGAVSSSIGPLVQTEILESLFQIETITLFTTHLKFYTFDENFLYVTPSQSGESTLVFNELAPSEKDHRRPRQIILDEQGRHKSEYADPLPTMPLTVIQVKNKVLDETEIQRARAIYHQEIEMRFNQVVEGFEGLIAGIKLTSVGPSSPYLDKQAMVQMKRAFCSCEKANIDERVLMNARKSIVESGLKKQIDEKKPFDGEKIKLRDLTCLDQVS